ncbi:hypothetical protein HYH03_008164 [Edaphochlamys debaryana]|uniref:Strictosidine synthase conserved region domain-containing protein n=1 Tax=Edaphochlamys debaryana TaxID=47281 RepID=A0A836BZ69_9CHLO|nr:hypothetical protein HYH03_008164 [Edaphochlamys debaryana]|eukprot:KAG2493647.1 hypothetical protein HYH03_008164 [Edaphochlamys debaryana]
MAVLFPILAAIAALGTWRFLGDPKPIPLPYPAHNYGFAEVDPDTLPLDPAPLQGVYAPNTLLGQAHILFEGKVHAAETLVLSPEGHLLMLDKYAYLHEAVPTGRPLPHAFALRAQPLAYLGPGRPLGAQHDAAGNLVFADGVRGLMMLEKGTQRLVTLSNRVSPDSQLDPGTPIAFANDLDISPTTGEVYFSQSQDIPVNVAPTGRVGDRPFFSIFHGFLFGMLSGDPTGRLLRYDPASGRTQALVRRLWYANGVALAADESFVAVAESVRARVMRHWLKGPKAGTTDVLIDRLPGFPDGISRAPDGGFWVALVAPVTKLPHALRFLPLRVLLAYLPDWARPPLEHWGGALKISAEGEPLRFLHDPQGGAPGHVGFVSAVLETEDRLYFGNVAQSYVSVLDKKDLEL